MSLRAWVMGGLNPGILGYGGFPQPHTKFAGGSLRAVLDLIASSLENFPRDGPRVGRSTVRCESRDWCPLLFYGGDIAVDALSNVFALTMPLFRSSRASS